MFLEKHHLAGALAGIISHAVIHQLTDWINHWQDI